MSTGALVIAAEHFAREAHRDQRRKFYDAPYFVHPDRCRQKAEQLGFPPHAVAAILCHDVMEDQGVTFDQLEEATDESVASLVWCLTNPSKRFPNLRRDEKKRMDREHAGRQSTLVRQLKLVDRTDNLQDMVRHADVTPVATMKRYAAESRELMGVLGERLVFGTQINSSFPHARHGSHHPRATAVGGTDPWLEREAWAAIRAVERAAERLEITAKLSDNPRGNSAEIPKSVVRN